MELGLYEPLHFHRMENNTIEEKVCVVYSVIFLVTVVAIISLVGVCIVGNFLQEV